MNKKHQAIYSEHLQSILDTFPEEVSMEEILQAVDRDSFFQKIGAYTGLLQNLLQFSEHMAEKKSEKVARVLKFIRVFFETLNIEIEKSKDPDYKLKMPEVPQMPQVDSWTLEDKDFVHTIVEDICNILSSIMDIIAKYSSVISQSTDMKIAYHTIDTYLRKLADLLVS